MKHKQNLGAKRTMDIRVLEASDARSYQELRLSALRIHPEAFSSTYEKEVQFSLETVAERIAPTQDKFVLGAVNESGSLVGIVTFMRESGRKMAHKGNVFGMYVAPDMRGRGVGKSLLFELKRKVRDYDGVEQINLTVVSDNKRAKMLYQSIGFKVYGTERNALKYHGQYYDEDLMALKI